MRLIAWLWFAADYPGSELDYMAPPRGDWAAEKLPPVYFEFKPFFCSLKLTKLWAGATPPPKPDDYPGRPGMVLLALYY